MYVSLKKRMLARFAKAWLHNGISAHFWPVESVQDILMIHMLQEFRVLVRHMVENFLFVHRLFSLDADSKAMSDHFLPVQVAELRPTRELNKRNATHSAIVTVGSL